MTQNRKTGHERASARYIVLLEKGDAPALKKIEQEFRVTITSSENLNRDNRSFNILSSRSSVFYKNLGMVVMEDVEPDRLMKSVDDEDSPVVYFEEERIFSPAGEPGIPGADGTAGEPFPGHNSETAGASESGQEQPSPVAEMEWGLKAIGLEKTRFTGRGIDICVLDTGFDRSHPDFGNRVVGGKSFVAGEDWDADANGHGTHCAGTAAGNIRLDTGTRYGVAPGSNLKVAKVLSDSGYGTTSSIIDAIDWAITKKFRVISLSLGSPVRIDEPSSLIFEKAGEKALENDCLIVAAAGNDSRRPSLPKPVSCPANSRSIMAVAAIDEQFRVARFSNGGINSDSGGEINVCAPGVNILSSFPAGRGNYDVLSGTSMAAPHVSGLAALYMEANPGMPAREIWQMLEKNARPIKNLKYRDIGKGLVQAAI